MSFPFRKTPFLFLAVVIIYLKTLSVLFTKPPVKEENLTQFFFQKLPDSLLTKETLNKARGKVLCIKYKVINSTASGKIALNLTLNIDKAYFPKSVQLVTTPSPYYEHNPKRFAYVIGRYWEQMSQSMRAFLSLVLQASGRSVVAPMVKDSRFQANGLPLGYYFDRKYIRDILNSYGYNDLSDKDTFEVECSPNDLNYTTVHFLYEQKKAATYTKNLFQLDDATYAKMSVDAGRTGWTSCPFIQRLTKQNPNSKMYCVNTSIITDWSVFETDVIRSAKCLSIVVWRGIGDSFRSRFKETGFRLRSSNFFHSLKPSPLVIETVENFRRLYLGSRYLAVHIRGEHIAIAHGIAPLKQCIHFMGYVLKRMKNFYDIHKVFVATDMSKYGSKSWKSDVKLDVVTEETLKTLQELALNTTNGISFDMYADKEGSVDRGLVALIEVNLVAQAQGLLTIGYSSFHHWLSTKFLDFHRNDPERDWSFLKICFNYY